MPPEKQIKPPHACCGAKTRAGSNCKSAQMPNGRCRMHGGSSTGAPGNQNAVGHGAPSGNKNAVSTGEHESIWLESLDDDEKALIARIVTDKMILVNNEILLTEIRIRRMLKRIAEISGGDEMLLAKERVGFNANNGAFTETTREHKDYRIQRSEDALTRVVSHKAKLIQIKHEFEKAAKEAPADGSGIDALIAALDSSRRHWFANLS